MTKSFILKKLIHKGMSMNQDKLAKVIASVGIGLNTIYAVTHIYEYINSNDLISKEYLLNFGILELSWVALLVWFLYDTYTRRAIMILYMLPLVGVNITHSIHCVITHQWGVFDAFINVVYGVLFSSIFLLAYIRINLNQKRRKSAT